MSNWDDVKECNIIDDLRNMHDRMMLCTGGRGSGKTFGQSLCKTCKNKVNYPNCDPLSGTMIRVIDVCPNYDNMNRQKVLVSEKPEIVVHGTKEKPYFEIKYKEVGNDDYTIGYSSYDLNNCFQWLEEEFEIVSEVVDILTEAEKLARVITFEAKVGICKCCDKYMVCANLHSSNCPILIKKIEDILKEERAKEET